MATASRREIASALKEASANMFFRYRYSMSYEVGLQAWGSRRADVIGNKISGDIVLIEVKSSVADFRGDSKFHEYQKFCDRMYLSFTKEVALKINKDKELMSRIPKRVGILILEDHGYMRVVKKALIVPVETSLRISILARLAWRAGELSKRTTRSRKRVFIDKKTKKFINKSRPKRKRVFGL
jgi:hypothetical protein